VRLSMKTLSGEVICRHLKDGIDGQNVQQYTT